MSAVVILDCAATTPTVMDDLTRIDATEDNVSGVALARGATAAVATFGMSRSELGTS
jgi:hypothetical protein